MKLQLGILALAVAAMSIAPAAMAAHGQAYTARGIATDAAGNVYYAEVYWGGWFTRSFEVTLVDAETAAPVVDHHRFLGTETWAGPVFLGTEWFTYRGWSLDPSVNFEITGIQIIQIQTGFLTMLYTGHYFGYELKLFV